MTEKVRVSWKIAVDTTKPTGPRDSKNYFIVYINGREVVRNSCDFIVGVLGLKFWEGVLGTLEALGFKVTKRADGEKSGWAHFEREEG